MVGCSNSCLYFPAFVVSLFNSPVPVFLFCLYLLCKVIQLITIEQYYDIVLIIERGFRKLSPTCTVLVLFVLKGVSSKWSPKSDGRDSSILVQLRE